MSDVHEAMYRKLYRVHMDLLAQLPFRADQFLQKNSELLENNNRLQNEVISLNEQLKMINDALNHKEEAFYQLRLSFHNLYSENTVLRQEIERLNNMLREQINRNPPVPEASIDPVKSFPTPDSSPTELPRSDAPLVLREHARTEPMTMAMKLKLSRANPDPESDKKVDKPKQADSVKNSEAARTQVTHTNRLFVGHLSPASTKKSVREYFKRFGDVVDVYFPPDKTGSHRGYCFVTFSKIFDAHPLDDVRHQIDGQSVYVDISSYGGIGAGESPSNTLLVSGIIHNVSRSALKKHFSKFGVVVEVVRPREAEPARWAFVHFEDCSSVELALREQHVVGGQLVDCRRAYNYCPEGRMLKEIHKKSTEIAKRPVRENTEKPVPTVLPKPQMTKPESPVIADKDIADVTKFLISHLTPKTTTEMLKKHFSKYGTVLDAYIPTIYGTSESKGFGYIVVPTKDLRFLNQKHMIDGVGVHISKEGNSGLNFKTPTLLVSAGPQIMKVISEDDLKKFFSRFGKVSSVRKFHDPTTKQPSHYAFVEFASSDSADKALKNLAYKINGHIICITKSRHEPHNK